MFNEKELISLQLFSQSIIDRSLPFDHQEAVIQGKDRWCADLWTLEVLRCLILSETVYRNTELPDNLKNNKIFSIEEICTAATNKMKMFDLLKKNKEFTDNIFICECGRGVDILLASFIKKWNKIVCYDINPFIREEVNTYFNNYLHLSVESFFANSGDYDFSQINYKTIVLANITRISSEQYQTMLNNNNLLVIVDGTLLK